MSAAVDDDSIITPSALVVAAIPSYAPLSSFHSAALLRSLPLLPAQPASTADPPFFKGVKWSPDASCLLTGAEDHVMRLYEVQSLMADTSSHPPTSPALSVSVGECVYDSSWYPAMHSASPATCGFLTTSRDHPIQLWDAFTGDCRCSYIGMDNADEPTAALSVCFSPSGDMVYAGYDGCIRLFDTATPGRDCTLLPLHTHPTPSSRRRTGQHGLISCLAATATTIAAGSYSGQVGLYCPTSLECLALVSTHPAGVSCLRLAGNLLYMGGRGKSGGVIRCYDLRCVGGGEVGVMERVCGDNQRVELDVGGEGRWVVSGSQDGRVRLWDLGVAGDAETGVVPVAGEWQGVMEGEGGGVVNGVSMHPAWGEAFPYLATVSGCRAFPRFEEETDSEEDGEDGQGTVVSEMVSRLSVWQVQTKTPAGDSGG